MEIKINYSKLDTLLWDKKQCGITAREICEKTNINPNYLSSIRTNRRKMSLINLCKLALVLKCKIDDLIEIEEVKD